MASQLLDTASQLADGAVRSADGLRPISAVDSAFVTHYGPSFNGQSVGCDDTLYSSDNASIVAVGPARYSEWPCGTIMRICGPGGCLIAERQDACPGCGPYHVDLSEQGLDLVCGPGSGVCKASVEAFAAECQVAASRDESAVDSPLELFATLAQTALEDRTASLLTLSPEEHSSPCLVQRRKGTP